MSEDLIYKSLRLRRLLASKDKPEDILDKHNPAVIQPEGQKSQIHTAQQLH